MKIPINDEGDCVGDAIIVHTLEDLEEYMQKHPSAVLYWNDEDYCLAIEDMYIRGMD